MAMYKNREVYIAQVVEQAQPAKVFVVAVGDPEANREIVNKSDVVVFDKNELPESEVVKQDNTKQADDWRQGYATPTDDQIKIHENNMRLRQLQAETKDEVQSFKPAKDSDLLTPAEKADRDAQLAQRQAQVRPGTPLPTPVAQPAATQRTQVKPATTTSTNSAHQHTVTNPVKK